MGRPPLPLGTAGEVRVYRAQRKNGRPSFRAVANYRDYDGVTRRVERRGRSETAARNALKIALRDRGRFDVQAEITSETKLSAVAELWYTDLDDLVKEGRRSPNTSRLYRDRLDNQVLPALGELRLREITVSRLDRFIKAVKEHHGNSTARAARAVLNGVMGLAVRHDAVERNPVRDVATLETSDKSPRSLTLDEARDLRAQIAADPVAQRRDLPDLTDVMLATGLRIGEAAAIVWDAIDFEAATVEVRGTVIRETGKGLRIKPKPKSKSGWRTLELPSWAVVMLRERMPDDAAPDDPVFTAPLGGLRDPNNTSHDLREAFDAAGYEWVTSHVYRKTVATLMDEANLSARAAADQLGHARVSMTQDVYFGRGRVKTGAATVLEVVADVS